MQVLPKYKAKVSYRLGVFHIVVGIFCFVLGVTKVSLVHVSNHSYDMLVGVGIWGGFLVRL